MVDYRNVAVFLMIAVCSLVEVKSQVDWLCNPYQSGNNPHPNVCNWFIQCNFGKVQGKTMCAEGTAYDPSTQNCDFREKMDCVTKPFSYDYVIPYRPYQAPVSYVCPTRNGRFPDYNDCKSYYECYQERPIKFLCYEGDLYDRLQFRCRLAAPDLYCGNAPFPAPGTYGAGLIDPRSG